MDSQSLMECISHVGLSIEARDLLKTGDNLALRHMAPPFTVTPQACVTAVGTAGLTANEVKAIDVFIDEVEQEYQASQARNEQQYHIHPHVKDVKAPDGTVIYRRFSCAGFVIAAYDEAGIDGVLNTDETQLPPVSLESLIMIYPDLRSAWRARDYAITSA